MTLNPNQNWNRVASFKVTVGKSPIPVFTIKDVRISFSVTKSTTSTANKGNITIYNLSESSRSILETPKGLIKFLPGLNGLADFSLGGVLEAGYAPQGLSGAAGSALNSAKSIIGDNIIFSGQFTKVKNSWTPPEWVTTLEAGDAVLDLNQKIMNNSFPAGTPVESMVNTALASLGVSVGSKSPIVAGISKFGEVAAGPVKGFLDKLAKQFGFAWSIQNGAVQIQTTPNTPVLGQAVLVSADTGLIGSPMKTDKGVEFDMLLNSKINPGTLVSLFGNPLEENSLSGLYIAKQVKHDGDTHGSKFNTNVEAEPIGL